MPEAGALARAATGNGRHLLQVPHHVDGDAVRVAEGPAGPHCREQDPLHHPRPPRRLVCLKKPPLQQPTPSRPSRRRLPNPSGSRPRRAHTIVSALKIGTDRGNFQGPEEGADHFPGAPEYPRYVGDSNCALIKAVGSEVKHFKVGERIVTRWPHQSDYVFNELTGDGVEDRDDQNNFGGLDGMLKVPDGVSAEDAVWAWLWTLSQACYQKSLFKPGETVRAATAPSSIPSPPA